jgi:Zn-finger nucleic acid-binding protein
MNCPRDGTHLSNVRIDGVKLDRCPKCAGIWLDRGELETVMMLKLSEVESNFEDQTATRGGADEAAGYMRCPRCPERRLQRISYTVMHPVRIDRCEQCLGNWLDKSELDSIVDEKSELEEDFSIYRLSRFLQSASAAAHGR